MIQRVTAATVTLVALAAGVLSARHCITVVSANGESGLAWIYPVSIDGLVLAASMSLLSAAHRKVAASRLAWVMLWAGIAATTAVNVLASTQHGATGCLIAAWPALALTGCIELLLGMVRTAADRKTELADPLMVAALTAYPDGTVPSRASIRRTLSISDSRAKRVQAVLAAQR